MKILKSIVVGFLVVVAFFFAMIAIGLYWGAILKMIFAAVALVGFIGICGAIGDGVLGVDSLSDDVPSPPKAP